MWRAQSTCLKWMSSAPDKIEFLLTGHHLWLSTTGKLETETFLRQDFGYRASAFQLVQCLFSKTWKRIPIYPSEIVYIPRLKNRSLYILGPRGLWLVGNVIDALRYGRHGGMMMWSKRQPDFFHKIFFGARSFLVTDNPAIARYARPKWILH